MKTLKILITNDDGVRSPGIFELAKRLAPHHSVTIVAPESERSAFSHAISIHRHLSFCKLDDICGAEAYSLDGTPADCVKFAFLTISREFDLVVSGINRGPNVGSDIMYSGTVSAAKEGAYMGIKSIAVSQLKYFAEESEPYIYTAGFVADNLEILCQMLSGTDYILNINHPGTAEIAGVKLTPQGVQVYDDNYQFETEGYILKGMPIPHERNPADCDVEWSKKGFVTVTPIAMNLTDRDALSSLRRSNPFG